MFDQNLVISLANKEIEQLRQDINLVHDIFIKFISDLSHKIREDDTENFISKKDILNFIGEYFLTTDMQKVSEIISKTKN